MLLRKFDDNCDSEEDRDSLIKQESSDIFSGSKAFGFKKVRSYDVLKTYEIGKTI